MAAVALVVLPPILLLLAASGHGQPWPRREPPVHPPQTHELASPERWPSEPATPDPIDPEKFRAALSYFCSREPDRVPADEVLSAAEDEEVDPFLLAALMWEQSRCDPKRKTRQGYGLLVIQPSLLLKPAGVPAPPVDRELLTPAKLYDPLNNLTVGARILHMWQEKHGELDEAFGGVPHRSGVAHFFWGDRVLNSGNEDMVLTARRRLVARYAGTVDGPRPSPIGLPLVTPLEGVPRVASSGPGEDRDGGLRHHRGLDIAASDGEPIHAVADGVVIFAGANLSGSPRHNAIPPSKIARYRHRKFGAGGIYLCIRHDLPSGTAAREVVTCYMHLSSYLVAEKDRVTSGQLIAFVGKTGVRSSPPHLHFEVRVDEKAKNPARYLTDFVIPPKATKTYRYVVKAKRARVKAARAAAASTSTGT